MKKIWRKISSKIIHKNPWWEVVEDDVIIPNGEKGKYYYVDGADSVMIVASDKDEIYLVGQTRYLVNNFYSWEIIGGGLKPG